MTAALVLKTGDHLDRFHDLLVHDIEIGEYFPTGFC